MNTGRDGDAVFRWWTLLQGSGNVLKNSRILGGFVFDGTHRD